jgi:hypothetical protein
VGWANLAHRSIRESCHVDLLARLQACGRFRTSVIDPARQGNNPWEALSNEREAEVLQVLIREEIGKALNEWAKAKPAR